VWIGEGRSGTLLITFFDQLGPERCAQTEAITMDMTRIWRGPVLEYLPNAAIYFDPFHVINGPATPSTWSTRPPHARPGTSTGSAQQILAESPK
jgi:transposase